MPRSTELVTINYCSLILEIANLREPFNCCALDQFSVAKHTNLRIFWDTKTSSYFSQEDHQ